MNSPLQIGILGCARIVRRAIAVAASKTSAVKLAAIASNRSGVAEGWARGLGIPRYYSDYGSVINDPEIDAVYIPLPNEQHEEWTLRAAAAGKHVLCEKPLARDFSEAETMVQACERASVILMEAFMWRHHPRVEHCLRIVREGKLGDIRLVKMDFSFPIAGEDWRLDPKRGGGALHDLGCYGINAARLFTAEEPVEVLARARMSESGVDMTTAITLQFASGALALLDCSFEAPDRNRLEIVGSDGTIVLHDGVLPDSRGSVLQTLSGVRETLQFSDADQYTTQFEAFAKGVRSGRLPFPAENGLANMRILDNARRMAWGINSDKKQGAAR